MPLTGQAREDEFCGFLKRNLKGNEGLRIEKQVTVGSHIIACQSQLLTASRCSIQRAERAHKDSYRYWLHSHNADI